MISLLKSIATSTRILVFIELTTGFSYYILKAYVYRVPNHGKYPYSVLMFGVVLMAYIAWQCLEVGDPKNQKPAKLVGFLLLYLLIFVFSAGLINLFLHH